MYHCETFGFSGFRAKETMIQESTTGILATDETRLEHGKGKGRRWGSAGASPYRVLRTVTMRIGSGLREGDRPRETPTLPGSLRGRKMGLAGTLALPLESNPCLIGVVTVRRTHPWLPTHSIAECGMRIADWERRNRAIADCGGRGRLGEASGRFGARVGDRAVRGRGRSRNGN